MQTATKKEPFLHKLTIKALAGQTVVSSLSAMKFNAQSRSSFFFFFFPTVWSYFLQLVNMSQEQSLGEGRTDSLETSSL